MTPSDLDKIEAAVRKHKQLTVEQQEQQEQWLDLLRLARRGLRAEQECCGRCEHWSKNWTTGDDGLCVRGGGQTPMNSDDSCTRWENTDDER